MILSLYTLYILLLYNCKFANVVCFVQLCTYLDETMRQLNHVQKYITDSTLFLPLYDVKKAQVFKYFYLKGIVDVEWHVRFTTEPFKLLSDQGLQLGILIFKAGNLVLVKRKCIL